MLKTKPNQRSRTAKRLDRIPPYLFAELDKKKAKFLERGVDVVSLAIGDPDNPTPDFIINKFKEALSNPSTHHYPPYEGTLDFKRAVGEFYERRFGVKLDPEKEVLALIGSKEGIAHSFLAFVNEGDIVLVPDPGYPVYNVGAIMAGAEPYPMPLHEKNCYLPSFEKIDKNIISKAKLLYLNYPSNPTTAVAGLEFLEEAVSFAKKHDLIICYDNAYSEITFDGYIAPSILQVKDAKDIAIEFNSLSKPYNMTGWRLGYAVGNKEMIKALGTIKNNVDSGVFTAIQVAGIEALKKGDNVVSRMKSIYIRRRDRLVKVLNEIGWKLKAPKATFYVWAPVPKGYDSTSFASYLLEESGILVAPGVGYGKSGEGYFRISITAPDERIEEAVKRLHKLDLSSKFEQEKH
ncbi:MAG: LL-diaminopimelate aminotransferase [Firmicutes bacterium]|nr:LL-diaminopimelate aminotransferase [Bacillota bacterium]